MKKTKPMLGIMLDCSRCAVFTVAAVKELILNMEKMGYNTLLLYLEDTYEIPEEPFFGYLRGRYTKEELQEIDTFADLHGVELIPCIQTLAHLQQIFRWEAYEKIRDLGDILLTDDPRTMELIENMFRALRNCVRSRQLHIGMDEAFFVGRGTYYDRHGHRDKTELLLSHLQAVCALAEKYDFQPMMWGDMFFRLASGGAYYGGVIPEDMAEKTRRLLPENLSLVYFDYHNTDKEVYRQMIRGFRRIGGNVIFAGASWTWGGFAPLDQYAYNVIKPALTVCREEGVQDVMITVWGDNGAECSPLSALPELLYAAEMYRGNTEEEKIKTKFEELFGESYDAVRSLSRINYPPVTCDDWIHSLSKALLYNDILLGVNDKAITADTAAYYKELSAFYQEQRPKTTAFTLLFRYMQALAEVLAVKSEIAVSLRTAYRKNDRQTLAMLTNSLLPELIRRLRIFTEAFRNQWLSEKKPFGLDVHELRIGGHLMRCESAQMRLQAYLSGELPRLEELEEDILPIKPSGVWKRAAGVYLDT